MKKIKLTMASLLVLLLVCTLLVVPANAQNYKMTSDVICATGGKAQSTSYTMKVSTGGQGSPIGLQSSQHYLCGGGWVYTTVDTLRPPFIRGDANKDGIISSADIVYLINYLFIGGPPPRPQEAGDANCDGIVSVADVVYLINYLFAGGPPPSCYGEDSSPSFNLSKLNNHLWKAEIGLSMPKLRESNSKERDDEVEIMVWGKSDQDIAGVQLEISYDPIDVTLLEPKLTSRTQGLSIFFGGKDGLQKIGIVDLTGKNPIPAGEGALVTLSAGSIGKAKGKDLASIQIKEAILVNREAKSLLVELSPNIQVKTEDATIELPDHFSLSQNHPNPFNPETNIEYALPKDTDIKLTIYNILGEKVKVLVDEHQTAGYKRIYWDGRDQKGEEVASGVYFYRLEAKEFSKVMKMMLVK